MLRWFKDSSRTKPEDEPQGVKAPGEARLHAHGKFRLEPLEPRVLLSADPLAVAVIGQALVDAASNPDSGAANAVVLQLNAEPIRQTRLRPKAAACPARRPKKI